MKNLLILLALFNAGSIYSQTMNDLKGWRDAEWGMSADTIKILFAKENIIENKAKQVAQLFNLLKIEEYNISGYNYEVNFFFTGNTYKLSQITLTRKLGFSEITSLESLLIEKYGNPIFKVEHPYLCKWNFPSTFIEIDFVEDKSKAIITYKQSK